MLTGGVATRSSTTVDGHGSLLGPVCCSRFLPVCPKCTSYSLHPSPQILLPKSLTSQSSIASKARRQERTQINSSLSSLNQFRQQNGSDRSQKNPISEMARGDIGSRERTWTYHRQSIGSARPQSCPRFDHLCVADPGHKVRCGLMQFLYHLRLYCLVESRLLNSCANQDSATFSRN